MLGQSAVLVIMAYQSIQPFLQGS